MTKLVEFSATDDKVYDNLLQGLGNRIACGVSGQKSDASIAGQQKSLVSAYVCKANLRNLLRPVLGMERDGVVSRHLTFFHYQTAVAEVAAAVVAPDVAMNVGTGVDR